MPAVRQLRVPVDVEHGRRGSGHDRRAAPAPCRGRCAPRPARPSRCTIRCTGAARATMSPSRRASRSGISCEPPTKRCSCAPLTVSRSCGRTCRRCARCPSTRRTRACRGGRARPGPRRSPGWVQERMRFSTPSALIALRRIHSPRVIASHSAAWGWVQGASTGISAAIWSIRVSSSGGVGEDRRVRRDGALVLQPPGGGGDVDAVAVDVLVEGAYVELAREPQDVVLGRADERAAGLDRAARAEVVVEHPAADPTAGLDEQHGPPAPGHAACGHEAGDAAADHDDVDLGRQRPLAGSRRSPRR